MEGIGININTKRRLITGLGGISLLLVGCGTTSPTVEGYVWEADLTQGNIEDIGEEEEEALEYIKPQLSFDEETVTMDFKYGDITEASPEVQFGMMFITGMLETLDLSTTYTEEDNILTLDPTEEMDVGGSYIMDWDGSDKVTLTPSEEGEEDTLVLEKVGELAE